MRHLGFQIMLDIESDQPIPKPDITRIAERIGFALQNWAQSSEEGLVGDLDAVTRGVVIRDWEGKYLATIKW